MKNKKILSMDEERLSARSREIAPLMWDRLETSKTTEILIPSIANNKPIYW